MHITNTCVIFANDLMKVNYGWWFWHIFLCQIPIKRFWKDLACQILKHKRFKKRYSFRFAKFKLFSYLFYVAGSVFKFRLRLLTKKKGFDRLRLYFSLCSFAMKKREPPLTHTLAIRLLYSKFIKFPKMMTNFDISISDLQIIIVFFSLCHEKSGHVPSL